MAASSSPLELWIWRSAVQASPVALFPLETRNFTTLFLFSPRCINGCQLHTAGGGGGGNPVMD